MKLTLGTRGSALARWQTDRIAAWLIGRGHEVAIEVVSTKGDRILDKPLPEIGGKGLFTAELEEKLRSGEIDLAVHSLKDLPTEDAPGLTVLAIPERADPRDAFVLPEGQVAGPDPVGELPPGAVVGTSSLRRRALLLHRRPDLRISDVRGNVGTRLRKLDEGQYDALLLACAGLDRLQLGHRVSARLDGAWLGAAGQGALGVQGRPDGPVAELVADLNHPATVAEVTAERVVLAELGGGCALPLGVSARLEGTLSARAFIARPDGSCAIRAEAAGLDPGAVGRAIVASLHEQGAADVLASL